MRGAIAARLWLLGALACLLMPACHGGPVPLPPADPLRNCSADQLCQGRSAVRPNRSREIHCYCDPECSDQGDCCIDTAPIPAHARLSHTHCDLTNFSSILAVSECGEGYMGERLRKLCRKSVKEAEYHYSLDTPVYSSSTGLHYANIYCALCHNETTTSLESLKFQIRCSNQQVSLHQLAKEGTYQKGKLLWTVGENMCFLVPEGGQLELAKDCVPSLGDCPPSAQPLVSEKCNAYTSPVSKGKKKVYKKADCSPCQDEEARRLSCWLALELRVLPSLSLIFDFDWDFDSCDLPNTVWDGLHQRCTIMCHYDEDCTASSGNSTNSDPYHMSLSLRIEGYVTIICLSVSIFFLLLHILFSFFIPQSKSLPGKILNSLSVSLLIAQILFLCGLEPMIPVPYDACQAIAVLIHFFFLSSFFWMNVMSIDIWRTFSNASFKTQKVRSHTKYALYAWGGAGFVSAFAALVDNTNFIPEDYRPYFAIVPNICWFGNRTGLAVFFFFPISILLIINTTVFAITVCWFQKQCKQSDVIKGTGKKEFTRLYLYIKLFIIMGLTWCCGMFSTFANRPNYRYPYIVLNGLQGTFLFIMFDLKSEHFVGIKKHLRCCRENKAPSTFTSTA